LNSAKFHVLFCKRNFVLKRGISIGEIYGRRYGVKKTEGKRQRERDRGERDRGKRPGERDRGKETQGKRQPGWDTGKETEGKRHWEQHTEKEAEDLI
jgi:hypothetical protein